LTALIAKTAQAIPSKITLAIIINFIYYRHSDLNVRFTPIPAGCSHPVFFYLNLPASLLSRHVNKKINAY